MNVRLLQRANTLRAQAIAANDCPILHAAADSALRLLAAENNDRVLLARAKARAARSQRLSRAS